MKDIFKSWKFWAIVLAVVSVTIGLILYFTVPAFKDLLIALVVGLACFAVGWIFGTQK